MAWCKIYALKRRKRNGEKEKRKGNRRKHGDKIVFYFIFFINVSPRAFFFSYAQWSFFG